MIFAFPWGSADTEEVLLSKSSVIIKTCEEFNVDPRTIFSVIYTERMLNYDWKDDALDVILAINGKNSSIGFCQIKLHTAYWIERNLNNPLSPYYLGKETGKRFPKSRYRDELIGKLKAVDLNIQYAVVYIAMFQRRWGGMGFDISENPGILGTLYSTGAYKKDGSERTPHSSPKMNYFGKRVKEVYESDLLKVVSP